MTFDGDAMPRIDLKASSPAEASPAIFAMKADPSKLSKPSTIEEPKFATDATKSAITPITPPMKPTTAPTTAPTTPTIAVNATMTPPMIPMMTRITTPIALKTDLIPFIKNAL